MKNRITHLFETKKKNILSIFFTAGYPNKLDTLTIIKRLDNAGVDLIEIGIPFSDPLADGPVVEKASAIAIENEMTLPFLFEQLQQLRQLTNIPIVLMGYLNPVLQYGVENFIIRCAEIGIDGYIIPDLPLEFYKKTFELSSRAHQVSAIMLISNQTPEHRIREIDQHSSGFLYVVSSNSITGENKPLEQQIPYYNKLKSMELQNPCLLGFGIHDKTTYELTTAHSNGAIIGSAFLKHIEKFGIEQQSITTFIEKIR